MAACDAMRDAFLHASHMSWCCFLQFASLLLIAAPVSAKVPQMPLA
jgi:hypothetical protein